MQNTQKDWTTSPAIASRIKQGAELETIIPRSGTPDAGLVVMIHDGRRKMLRVRNAFGRYPQVREALPEEVRYHVGEFAPERMHEFFAEETPDGRTEPVLRDATDELPVATDAPNDTDESAPSVPKPKEETEESKMPSRIEVDTDGRDSPAREASSSEPAARDTATDESHTEDEEAGTETMEKGGREGQDTEPGQARPHEAVAEGAPLGASDEGDTPQERTETYERIERTSGPLAEEDATERIEVDQSEEENLADTQEDRRGDHTRPKCEQMGGILASLMD